MSEQPARMAARLFAVLFVLAALGCSDPSREARELAEKHPVAPELQRLERIMKQAEIRPE